MGVRALYGAGLQASTERVGWRWTLLVVFIFGILLDAASTYWLMASGLGEEANPAAHAGMGLVGVEVYILLATLASLVVFPPLALAPPRTWEERVVVGFAFLVCCLKLAVATSNTLLMLSLVG